MSTSKEGIVFVNHNEGSTLLISRGRRPEVNMETKLSQTYFMID